ncbi:MAG: carbohydrate-binding module family 20 domain-containing protein [Rhodothermales bacterium]
MKRITLSVPNNKSEASKWHLILYITLLCSIPVIQSNGQAASVKFVVNLQYTPLVGNQTVVLRGSSATLGRWHGGDLKLLPAGGGLYSITVPFPERDLSQVHFYKFAILEGDDVRWESRPSRSFTLAAGHQSFDVVFFNDLDRPALTEDLEITFALDMDAYPGEHPAAIGISGERWPLGPIAPSQLVLMSEEGNLWQATVLFEAGTPVDLAFYFYFEIDGRWQMEGRRHAVMINNNKQSRTIELAHDGKKIVPTSRVRDLMTDDFEAIAYAIGDSGKRYLLDAALLQLESGHLNQANSLYNQFTPYFATATNEQRFLLQDLYPIRYGQALYRMGQKTEARNYLSSKESNARTSVQRAAYAHAIAAAEQAAGDLKSALSSYEGVESSYSGDAAEASALGRGITQLRLGAYSSGTQKLESIDGTRRRAALKAIGYAHTDSTNYELAIEAFDDLSQLGTDAEQIKARLLKLEIQLRAGELDEALAGAEALLSEQSAAGEPEERLRRAAANHYRRAHLIYLKALILERQGLDASALFQHVITNYADTKYAARAQRRIGG